MQLYSILPKMLPRNTQKEALFPLPLEFRTKSVILQLNQNFLQGS